MDCHPVKSSGRLCRQSVKSSGGFNFTLQTAAPIVHKAPNVLRMRRERLPGPCLLRFKAQRRQYYVYKAASKLWAQGTPWQTALAIMEEAFNATTYE